MQGIVVIVLFCSVTLTLVAYAADPASANKNSATRLDRIATDIKLVEKLVTNSSITAATETDRSGSVQKSEAEQYLEEAKKAHAKGDQALAEQSIKKAKAAIFAAARQSETKDVDDKLKMDYEKRIQDVRALLDAVRRIGLEKKQSAQAKAIDQKISGQLAKAESLFRQAKLEEAKKTADSAFALAKQFIIDLRDGDTLVRELNFANKEEEYKYELDRNETHKMLVTVLLQDKMSNPNIAKKVTTNMDEARKYRIQADTKAAKKDFKAAVEILENSTEYIIRAIRAAGVYIPG